MGEAIATTRDLAVLERRPGTREDRDDVSTSLATNDAKSGATYAATDAPAKAASQPHPFVPVTPQEVVFDGSIVTLDRPHPNPEARDRFGRRMPIEIDGLAWLPQGASLPTAVAGRFRERFRLSLRTQVAWRPDAREASAPLDVVKQVSFLHASAGTDPATFRDHYRRHIEIARRHMPALWQYVQNEVEAVDHAAPEAVGVMAVSELWFRTTDDFLNRYFPSEQDQRDFSAQEGFLDLSRATSFICTSQTDERSANRGRGDGPLGDAL